VRQQRVGGEQHDFEEDEEIEQVAGQESAEQAHQLQLEQRVEMFAALVEAGTGVEQRSEAQDRGQQDIAAASRSTTSTMPKGAGQSPSA
jgi:hypothetical protein